MMSHLKCLLALSFSAMLAGCFVSETPLIASGEAVLPADGSMVVCLEENDPCLDLGRDGDGYYTETPEDDELEIVRVRFAPLAQAGGRQVYVAEAGLETADGTAYIYGLARRLAEPGPRGETLQVAALDCDELTPEARDRFEADGGTVSTDKLVECQPASLAQFRAVVLEAHRESLGSDEWWLAHSEDL